NARAMKIYLELIQNLPALHSLCSELEAQLDNDPYLAVDTEFIRERTYYPQLALIQLATAHGAWLVDPLSFSPEEMDPLLQILKSERTLKFLHSAGGDQECFFFAYGTTVQNTLDTYEAAS